MLDETPTNKEISDTLFLLPAGKSPGPDGVSREVMVELWPVIGNLFCEVVVEFWESGRLHPYFKEGLLFLLPKTENTSGLAHWRPITLLNTVYKVIAKLLALRLAVVLPGLVPVEQQGFLKGRSMQNCILTFALVHENLKRHRKGALFFTLDQEKAYDRLLPQFIWETMEKLGFSRQFRSIVQGLQTDAETRILLGGDLLPAFEKENANGEILPVVISTGQSVSCTCLADDVAGYMAIDERSVRNLFALLKDLEFAAGGKVNVLKSKVLVLGSMRRLPAWLNGIGLQVIGKGQATRYLGVDNGQEMLGRITRKAQSFSQPSL
ncbi:hypothetical protein R1sor_025002 [Riccia sorocarpa]|uniref:Reverse transcriptase domain-containing protein n=1 Tax=Riccia sorocarpa TaxID=122646 RepID=A0ABD3GB81_9MARC